MTYNAEHIYGSHNIVHFVNSWQELFRFWSTLSATYFTHGRLLRNWYVDICDYRHTVCAGYITKHVVFVLLPENHSVMVVLSLRFDSLHHQMMRTTTLCRMFHWSPRQWFSSGQRNPSPHRLYSDTSGFPPHRRHHSLHWSSSGRMNPAEWRTGCVEAGAWHCARTPDWHRRACKPPRSIPAKLHRHLSPRNQEICTDHGSDLRGGILDFQRWGWDRSLADVVLMFYQRRVSRIERNNWLMSNTYQYILLYQTTSSLQTKQI